jgi:DNA-binding LacI/PurR family transcriptional regulator
VDGILVMASRVGTLYASLLSKTTVPIVLVNSQQGGGRLHSVAIDNVTSARKATAHLIELGHRRIAYIGNQARVQADPERAAGYRQALREAGLRPRRNLVAFGDGKPEGGLEAMGKLLELPEPPTAVFCYNDMSAFGALRMIQKSGLRVPHDISIVGFDDLSLASYMNPPLTTIRQPRREMGRRATEILLKLFEGSRSRNAVRFEGELVVRESTAASPPSRKLSPRH